MSTPDQIHAIVLASVKGQFETSRVPGVKGYGPVTDGNGSKKKDCVVLLDDPNVTLPSIKDAIDPDSGDKLTITVLPHQAPQSFRSLFSEHGMTRRAAIAAVASMAGLCGIRSAAAADAPAEPDIALSDPEYFPLPLMGGDPVYNEANASNGGVYWGSIGLIASKVTFKLEDGSKHPYYDVCISCDHVLRDRASASKVVSAFAAPRSMTYQWSHPDIGKNGKWVDIAVAKNTASADVGKLRGTGQITGVSEPALGLIVLKYGATTGLTAGVDEGLVYRPFPDFASTDLYLVRLIRSRTGKFSSFGDSGSAIVDQATRQLVGFVVGGAPLDDGGIPRWENYYLPTLELDGKLLDPNQSAVRIQLN